jgi:predicted metal-dependent phosphoesterase TrpH
MSSFRKYIDLHTHTWISDGTESPSAVIRAAAKIKLSAIAITDHDTIAGLPEAARTAAELDIEFIRGCEITAHDKYTPMHFLGLWVPEDATLLTDLLQTQHERRIARNMAMLKRLAELGVPITSQELHDAGKGDNRGRPHMARALIRRKYVSSVEEAFQRFLGHNAPAYVPMYVPSPEEIVSRMKDAGITVVFAHPMLIDCPRDWLEGRIRDLKACGLDALETYHSDYTPEQTRYCVDLAQRFDLALCGGSDFHGTAKPGLKLGTGCGGLRVPYFALERLKELRSKQGFAV